MTPEELERAQNTAALDDIAFANFLCVDERNLRRWKLGVLDIPRWVKKFLPALIALDEEAEHDPLAAIDAFFDRIGL